MLVFSQYIRDAEGDNPEPLVDEAALIRVLWYLNCWSQLLYNFMSHRPRLTAGERLLLVARDNPVCRGI